MLCFHSQTCQGTRQFKMNRCRNLLPYGYGTVLFMQTGTLTESVNIVKAQDSGIRCSIKRLSQSVSQSVSQSESGLHVYTYTATTLQMLLQLSLQLSTWLSLQHTHRPPILQLLTFNCWPPCLPSQTGGLFCPSQNAARQQLC